MEGGWEAGGPGGLDWRFDLWSKSRSARGIDALVWRSRVATSGGMDNAEGLSASPSPRESPSLGVERHTKSSIALFGAGWVAAEGASNRRTARSEGRPASVSPVGRVVLVMWVTVNRICRPVSLR